MNGIEARALNHVGIAVRSIDAHLGFWERTLGARLDGIETVEDQKVRVAVLLVGPPGQAVRVELLEPTAPDSPIARFLEKRGEGIHHLAFTVDGIERRLEALEAAGFPLIDREPRPGAHGTRIAFLHPRGTGGILTELCE